MAAFLAPDPGAMTARLVLQAPVETGDGQGGVLSGYEDVARLWGRVEMQGQALSERAGAELAVVTRRVTVAWRDDLRAGQRLMDRDVGMMIRAAYDPDGTRRFLVLICEEEAA